jgi:hypothetical protein
VDKKFHKLEEMKNRDEKISEQQQGACLRLHGDHEFLPIPVRCECTINGLSLSLIIFHKTFPTKE